MILIGCYSIIWKTVSMKNVLAVVALSLFAASAGAAELSGALARQAKVVLQRASALALTGTKAGLNPVLAVSPVIGMLATPTGKQAMLQVGLTRCPLRQFSFTSSVAVT